MTTTVNYVEYLRRLARQVRNGTKVRLEKQEADVFDLIADYIMRPPVEEVREQWQPIETAPKDGTAILIWQPDATQFQWGNEPRQDDNRYAIGYWRVQDEHRGLEGSWGNRNSSQVTPTHWMPLPEPPKP